MLYFSLYPVKASVNLNQLLSWGGVLLGLPIVICVQEQNKIHKKINYYKNCYHTKISYSCLSTVISLVACR